MLLSVALPALALLLGGCDDGAPSAAATCVGPNGALAVGEAEIDPLTCVRCECNADGTLGCINLPGCQPADAGPDRGPRPDEGIAGGQDASPEACTAEQNGCVDPMTARRCLPNGQLVELECVGEERCVLDRCARPICTPGELYCSLGRRKRCDETGFDGTPEPCGDGHVCVEDRCVDPQGDVLLVIDTSGSMLDPVAPPTPQDFPVCEDPDAPYTRIGLVKRALRELFASEAADGLRLAMQRFPQTTRSLGVCGPGHYQAADTLPGHTEQPSLTRDQLSAGLPHILAVPFTADGSFPAQALDRWIDFDEQYGVISEDCVACPSDSQCVDGECVGHLEPELRAQGSTPLGRSLFYGSEYFRHFVLREGKACRADADCDSPHYTCQDGACHDPLYDCRPYVVILFTDGGESVDPEPDDLFNPVVQARRLNLGLDCADAGDCFAPAECLEGRCVTGRCQGAPTEGCLADADCGT
ncbi:MAG: hypothetical protein KC613_27985, partial [Myxococcales bacterium]|nr:hypothetical protein [Myxococcales bacterium]